MVTKEYIESGNLEAYVLGALTPEEEAQVRIDVARDPQLALELAAIEDALLDLASATAMVPPAALDDKIWHALQPASVRPNGTRTPASPHFSANQSGSDGTSKTMPLPATRHNRQWRYAAMWVVLGGSLALNAMFWNRNNTQKEQFAEQTARITKMAAEQSALVQTLDNFHKRAGMMADTGMQTIVMHTIVKNHPMAATMYWSRAKGDAYVVLDALPEPPKGMQYQLWVIQGGKPVSMGVLPVEMAGTASIRKIDMQVTDGQAFAISLEKEGGSPSPTAENIYVLGKS